MDLMKVVESEKRPERGEKRTKRSLVFFLGKCEHSTCQGKNDRVNWGNWGVQHITREQDNRKERMAVLVGCSRVEKLLWGFLKLTRSVRRWV